MAAQRGRVPWAAGYVHRGDQGKVNMSRESQVAPQHSDLLAIIARPRGFSRQPRRLSVESGHEGRGYESEREPRRLSVKSGYESRGYKGDEDSRRE